MVGDQGIVPCTTHLQVLQSAAERERERERENTCKSASHIITDTLILYLTSIIILDNPQTNKSTTKPLRSHTITTPFTHSKACEYQK